MASPTSTLIDRMRSRDDWDNVIDDVPIFRAHKMVEVGEGQNRHKVPVLPGEKIPEGGRVLYEITDDDLDEIARAINRNLDRHEKPIKLFAGHTKNPKDQDDQPALVGYGERARVGRWGPEKVKAILNRWFIERGQKSRIKDMPERSPEFYPATNEITAIALLKTDPKLPMGMLTYHRACIRSDGAVLYGRENPYGRYAMGDELDLEKKKPPVDDREKKEDEEEPEELSPEEARTAMRYMSHYERHHPVMKYMCSKYGAEMANAGPTNGNLPGSTPPEDDDDEDEQVPAKKVEKEPEKMSREMQDLVRMNREQAQQIALLNQRNKKADVREVLNGKDGLKSKVIITEKAEPRVIERYMKADPKEWPAITEEILDTYQPRNGDPTTDPWLPTPIDYQAEYGSAGSADPADEFDPSLDQKAAERYGTEKGFDFSDIEQWNECVAYAVKLRKERRQGQTNGHASVRKA